LFCSFGTSESLSTPSNRSDKGVTKEVRSSRPSCRTTVSASDVALLPRLAHSQTTVVAYHNPTAQPATGHGLATRMFPICYGFASRTPYRLLPTPLENSSFAMNGSRLLFRAQSRDTNHEQGCVGIAALNRARPIRIDDPQADHIIA
jgi:hypothetical protein